MYNLKYISFICAAIISIGSFGITGISAEEEADKTVPEQTTVTDVKTLYTIQYDLNGGEGKISQTDPVAGGEDVKLSVWALKREGYSHIGWTDGVNTYKRGQIIKMPTENIKLTAVWSAVYMLTYEDLSKYGYNIPLVDHTVVPGTEILLPNYAMFNGKAQFNGWLVNGEYYAPRTTFIMPEKDTYVCPDWLNPITLTYSTGTSDGVLSQKEISFVKYPGSKVELPDSSRLARLGYKLNGWYDPLIDKSYKLEETYVIPGKDTVIEAKWTPIKIAIGFNANGGTGKMDKIIQTYDTDLKLPECTFSKEGSKLLGWDLKGRYYAPDGNFHIRIEKFGESPEFKAIWIDQSIDPGDLDGNNSCDITDMTLLSLYLLKDYTLSDEASKNADVVRDDEINLVDLTTYKQYIMHEDIILGMEGKKE